MMISYDCGIPFFFLLHSSMSITMASGIPNTDGIRMTMMVTNLHVKTVGNKHIIGRWGSNGVHRLFTHEQHNNVPTCMSLLSHIMHPDNFRYWVELLYGGGIGTLKCVLLLCVTVRLFLMHVCSCALYYLFTVCKTIQYFSYGVAHKHLSILSKPSKALKM